MSEHDLSDGSSLHHQLQQLKHLIPELEQQAADLSQSRKLQAALFEISELSYTERDMDAFFRSLHRVVGELMYAESFLIAVLDTASGDIRFVYFADSAEPDVSCGEINAQDQGVLRAGLTYHVICTGELIHVDEAGIKRLKQEHAVSVAGAPPFDWLGVPLREGKQTLGALAVQSYDQRFRYSKEDEQVLEFVCRHIASALHRKRAREALQQAHDELEERVARRTQELSRSVAIQTALYRIARLAAETIELKDFYAALHEAISELLEARNLYIALVDAEAGLLRYPYIVDQTEPSWPDEPLPENYQQAGLTFQVLGSGESFLYRGGENDLPPGSKGQPAVAWLGVPLRSHDQVIGVLAVQSYDPDTCYNDGDQELLSFVGQHVATAIQHQQDQQALDAARRGLEHRVTERTAELERANQQLRGTLSRLRETQDALVQAEKLASLGALVAGVAHEINTPLGVAITAVSHLMEQDRSGAVDSGRREAAAKLILDNLDRASRLVSSFKQVAVDQSSGDARSFNLLRQLDLTLTSLRPLLHEGGHQVQLDCPDDIDILGYPGTVYQIVSNLITNSVYHGFDAGQAGEMRLAVEARDDAVHLTYRDNGRGLDGDARQRIYEPFFTTARARGNSGLGMHIVFNHVTRLGGSIDLASEPGGGVRFDIRLPRDRWDAPVVPSAT